MMFMDGLCGIKVVRRLLMEANYIKDLLTILEKNKEKRICVLVKL